MPKIPECAGALDKIVAVLCWEILRLRPHPLLVFSSTVSHTADDVFLVMALSPIPLPAAILST